MLLCRHLKLLLIVLGLFAAPTFAAAQRNDEPNIIKPTPALRLASVDDLTTVLLVNNDGAGRLGDGLGYGHGRYLSVRPEVGLLTSTARTFIQEGITTEYATQVVGTTLENGRLYAQYLKKSSRVLYEGGNGPSVVTSWVGDSVQSRSYLESHNDLFNADAPNWRDIDDSLDDIASVPFVGNTDFLKPKESSDSTVVVTPLVTKINKISSAFKPVAITEDTARKLAAQKVLPVGDLPTFTVKNHFEPSGYQAIDTDTNVEEEGRSAKVYYQHLMRGEKQSEQRSQPQQQQLLSLPKRVLSTVTYYGFADFTTVVGDSVIVFSPSTAQPSSVMGHVTSIKGMATLRTEDLPVTDTDQVQVQVEVKVSTDTETKETIQVTETVKTTAPELIVATANATDTTEFVEVVSSSQTTENLMATATPTLEQTETQTKSMFSLPTDEEIQKIYASLAQAQAKEQAKEQSQSESESQSQSQSKLSVSIEATETGHSGATTIFIDDDPFANFIEPTRVINSTVTATSTTTQPETTLIEASTSTVKELAEESTTVAATTAQVSQFVKEITSENTHDASCDEVRSQVFLTQVPMQITLEQTVSPTYDIKETTKYYCIQASQVKETTELKTSTTTESEVDSVVESQSEAPQAEDDDETTVNSLEETQTEVNTTTEESPSTEAATEAETDADEEDSTTELTETNQDNDQDNENENENEDYDTESGLDEIDVIYKTLYTTYTYLTTFFQGQSTTVSSHTEIVTNVITSEVSSTQEAVSTTSSEISATETDSIQATATVAPSKYIIPDELDSLLHASANDASETVEHNQETSLLDDAKYTKTFFTTYTYYTTIFADTETEIMSRTEVFTNYVTELATTTTTTEAQTEESSTNEEHIRLVTDVRSSSSSGDQQQQLVRDSVDDQVSSESNTEEILPSATLLLQTSFTTFTFYTTMYVSDVTNVVSRLETVTNIATETVQPTKMLSQEEATLPITYFTTFTYWTKLAKDGEITTISREETISNVIEPTKRAETETETETATVLSSITDNLEKSVDPTPTDSTSTDLSALTTYYTTYTYYTTSYEANNTVTDSRLETITNIVSPSASAVLSSEEFTQTSLPVDISPSTPSSEESNTSDLIFYDYKHIIDAEGVSTLYFTTKIQASTNDEGSRVELTSSTSSLHIDETKKLNLATSSASESLGDPDSISATQRQYKTGLVRLIEGTRIGNSTTTLYQSKVIGTIIENRYAQIIESTSSFLFEKATPSSTISPSVTVDDIIVSTTQAVNLDSPPVVEGSINTETETTTETETETETEHEEHDEDDNNINSNNARIPFQTKKRTFAPVIRPFASRNRPTFAPKQKTASASSATIITRSDITPTITATPALKSVGRFGSSRRGSSSSSSLSNAPNNPHETGSTSRRLFGRPLKTSSGLNSQLGSTLQASSAISPSRNRFASTFRTSGIQASSSRRLSLGPSYRPSALSSGLSSRPRIKPTAASGSAFGKASTSAVGEETSTEAEQQQQQLETADEEENNTTENAKRSQNPLLRFRRPLSRPIGFTPAPANGNAASGFTVSPRRNPFAGRAKATTTSTTTTTTTARPKPRSFQRPTISSVQARNRPQNALFPPRGLFQSQQQQQQQQKENEQSAANNQNENDADNDSEYEDDDDDEDAAEDDEGGKEESRRRRSNKKVLTHSRVRREADTVNRSRFRFRRPKTALTEEPKIEEINETTSSAPRPKINSRFGSRFQSQTSSTEASSSSAPSGHRSIRPTRPTSPRTQFTLREKDTTIKSITRPSSSNFRRQQPTLRRSGSSSPTSSSRRLKNYTNHNHNAAETTGLRTTGTTRSRNTANGSSRGRSSMRGRNRNEFPNLTDQGSATITVTHIIPAEVTVPVVNGQVTEYKNIVTGKTSLEVLGPNQYTRMLGNNGQTSLYLTREDTSISPAGVTELTRYLLHDTPTTTVTFTPTTIRGRKTSFSHVLPSTVYSVENVVSTVQPQISANAPLANILLSQLLLGNINLPANQLLGALGQPQPQLGQEPSLPAAPAQPQTEYRTHTSTYVTTIYDGKSTILPITFQGKKILTTVFDTTAQTITATEYSVDTIITTPTQQPQLQPQGVQGQGQVNSLLLQQLLLQQQQQQQLQPIPQVLPTTMPQIFLGENLQDLDNPLMDADNNNIDDIIVSDIEADHAVPKSSGRKKSRKSGKSHKRNKQQQQQQQQPKQEEEESSVITLYVSGRRPGEFSTILSTVYPQEQSSSLHKRQVQQQTTATAELHGPEDLYEFGASEKMSSYSYLPLDECQGSGCELKSPTASLESIIGDVDLWYAKATKQASRPPMSFSSTASSSASAQMITAESDNLQVTNLSTTHPPSTMPRLRKVLVRRKPISGYPTLVNNTTNNNMKLSGQPKKHRVVIFKYRSARRMKSSTAETFKSSESTTLPTLQPTLQPSMDQNQQRFYLLTTSSTELSTRTYTYVVERVHNDQHETLQSYSTFTRVNTRILPITLTVETAVVSTQIHS
ncbi:hypothetical protein ACLKA7_005161 [Drosophila subpalustris]